MNTLEQIDSALVDLEQIGIDIERLTATVTRLEEELTDVSSQLDKSLAALLAALRNAPGRDESVPNRDGRPMSSPAVGLSELEQEWAGLLPEGARIA